MILLQQILSIGKQRHLKAFTRFPGVLVHIGLRLMSPGQIVLSHSDSDHPGTSLPKKSFWIIRPAFFHIYYTKESYLGKEKCKK